MKNFFLIPRWVVKEICLGEDLVALLKRFGLADCFATFPDGSLQSEGSVVFGKMQEAFKASNRKFLYGQTFFRDLPQFSHNENTYKIVYDNKYNLKTTDKVGFLNSWGITTPPKDSIDLKRLGISVFFVRSLNSSQRLKFVSLCSRWLAKAELVGAFGEGPIKRISSGIDFVGSRAQLFIDASSSGQNTLNWLTLVLFDFGLTVQTINQVGFGLDPLTATQLTIDHEPVHYWDLPVIRLGG